MNDAAAAELATASIHAEVARKVSFATHQCDVLTIVSLSIRNDGDVDLDGLTLTLAASPAVNRSV
jgi:hypothetical protein